MCCHPGTCPLSLTSCRYRRRTRCHPRPARCRSRRAAIAAVCVLSPDARAPDGPAQLGRPTSPAPAHRRPPSTLRVAPSAGGLPPEIPRGQPTNSGVNPPTQGAGATHQLGADPPTRRATHLGADPPTRGPTNPGANPQLAGHQPTRGVTHQPGGLTLRVAGVDVPWWVEVHVVADAVVGTPRMQDLSPLNPIRRGVLLGGRPIGSSGLGLSRGPRGGSGR
jgi:hypothetical protein